ncbi:MAG: FAD-binding oxidoreductase, partial [Gammaproteobacteria bacterium]|nr:FAD-binding oxidoreductase [Gammaproteobacteria bacterium]
MQQVAEKLATRNIQQLGRRLRDAIGDEKVKDDELVRISYASDVSPVGPRKPAFVVLPEQRDDVVAVLKIASEYRIPVAVMGGGINASGNTVPSEDGILMDIKRMDRILEINTDSGYALIEAGVNHARLSAALREKGYRMHMNTAPAGATALGGSLARGTGSLTARHFDSIVDLEVVLPDGTVFNTGSSMFPKAGHHLRYGPFPDLAGLLTCSYGTLGVITKASFRIYPINESNRVHLAGFDEFGHAVDYIKDLLHNNIPEHCIIWSWQVPKSFEVTIKDGQFWVPPEARLDPRKPPEGIPYNVVTSFLSGYEETMQSHEKVCAKVAAKHGGRAIPEDEARRILPAGVAGWNELYARYRPMPPDFFGLGQYLVWIMLAEPRNIKKIERMLVDELADLNIPPICYYAQPFDFGRSIFFRIFCFPDPADREMVQTVRDKYQRLFQTAMENYGAVPFRFKYGFPSLEDAGAYGEVLKRIKKAL